MTMAQTFVIEIIREALRGMMERERRLEWLDTAMARGVADAEAGQVQDIDEVRTELRSRFAFVQTKTASEPPTL